MSNRGHTYPRICAVCGEPFQARSPSGRYCDKPDCQKELRRIKSQRKRAVKGSEEGVVRDYAQEERVREAYKAFKKSDASIREIANKAAELGMSYGQYVGRYGK